MVSMMSDRNNPGDTGKQPFDLQSMLDSELISAEKTSIPPESTAKASKSERKTRFSALIVDDNLAFQKLLGLSLSMHPQIGPIDCADNGQMAIDKAKTYQYDIIFMDAMMPGVDGYQACAQLRESPNYKNTPIIMVSGLTEPYDEAKAFIAGSTTYVTKPVQQIPFKALLTRVLHILEYKNE